MAADGFSQFGLPSISVHVMRKKFWLHSAVIESVNADHAKHRGGEQFSNCRGYAEEAKKREIRIVVAHLKRITCKKISKHKTTINVITVGTRRKRHYTRHYEVDSFEHHRIRSHLFHVLIC